MEDFCIGIVTVTYNSEPYLKDFFRSLESQERKDWKLFIVDNDSKDHTRDLLRALSSDKYSVTLNSKNVGIAAGNNQGIHDALSAGAEYILLLNNDTVFEPDMLSRLVRSCEMSHNLIAVPKILYDDPKDAIWYAGGGFNPLKGYTSYHAHKGTMDRGQFDVMREVDYSPTCCMLVHRSVFSSVGFMDERYFVYYDDTDFCIRVRRKGITMLFDPGVAIVHRVGGSTGGVLSVFTCRFSSRNRLYFLRKHFGFALALLWTPVFLLYYLVELVIRRYSLDNFKASVAGTFEAYKMSYRPE